MDLTFHRDEKHERHLVMGVEGNHCQSVFIMDWVYTASSLGGRAYLPNPYRKRESVFSFQLNIRAGRYRH